MSALGEIINARNIKQGTLAVELKISKSAVSQQVKSGIKNIDTARKYAGVIGCNPLLLLD
ncbi:MAG: helix-turn-helix domain-containing protein [Victivallaceae bacterium]|jgi:diketogulonate reductase-like aldo/keto reductase